ncbi:putative reverse transcriptase domain, ribonuclease H-like domain protein [Tanacetum coccineum]
MQKMGIIVSTIHAAIKFYTLCRIGTVFSTYKPNKVEEGQKKVKETIVEVTKDVLCCVDTEERIIVNDKHPEQTVVIGKQLPTSFKRKLQDLLQICECFCHKLNEYKNIKPLQQKKRGLAPERNEAACKEVDELTKFLKRIHADGHPRDFDRLWSINMKLDPNKFSFGVEEGTFLGHLITKKGIKAKVIKIGILPRIVFGFARSSLPFFKALKSCTDKKSIQWTSDAEEAFRKMKEYIEILPTLTTPIKGKVLLEKLILALVHAARRLRRYFQAHPIKVLTDKPIKQILTRPEKSGRIAKWAIELGEHDIEFQGRNSVRGHILADFLVETPSTKDKDTEIKKPKAENKALKSESTWKLYTDVWLKL